MFVKTSLKPVDAVEEKKKAWLLALQISPKTVKTAARDRLELMTSDIFWCLMF